MPPTAKKLAELQTKGRDIADEYYDIDAKKRVAYRRANPTVDGWLLLMGRVTVPQTQMARQIAMRELQQRGLPLTIIPKLEGLEGQGIAQGISAPAAPYRTAAPKTVTVRRF